MDRQNRGDLIEEGEKKKTIETRENKKLEKKFIQMRQQREISRDEVMQAIHLDMMYSHIQ